MVHKESMRDFTLPLCAVLVGLLSFVWHVVGATSAVAAPDSGNFLRAEPVGVGMTYRDVVKRWGPAREKIEFETHRRSLWQYAGANVMFEQGKIVSVSAWTVDNVPEVFPASHSSATEPSRGVRERVSPEAEKVLSEILQEIPSNPDGSSEGLPPPGGYGAPPPSFSPPPPPPNLLAPYGSAPSEMYSHGLSN